MLSSFAQRSFQSQQISQTVQQIKNDLQNYCINSIAPIAYKIDQQDYFDQKQIWKDFGQIGVLGPTVSKEFGGGQLGYLAHCLFIEEISKVSASVGLSYIAHSNLCTNQISQHGTKEQMTKYLPKLCSGDEPGEGSDTVGLELSAKKSEDGQHYVLNGDKMWITNGSLADVFIVYAKTEPDNGDKGITTFLVEKNYGVQIAKRFKKLGMRGSQTAELVFNDVKVPVQNILGEINQGIQILINVLDYERLCLSAGPIGIMQAAYEILLPYLYRMVCDNGDKEAMGQIYSIIQACKYTLHEIAQRADNNEQIQIECATLFLRISEECVAITNQIMSLLGLQAFEDKNSVDRLLRDSKLYEIGGGTNEIRKMLIGRDLIKSVTIQKYQNYYLEVSQYLIKT